MGAFRALRGTPGVHRSADVRYSPVDCGMEVSFTARAGDRTAYSVFLVDRGHIHVETGLVSSGGTAVTLDPPGHVAIERGYVASSDPSVLRARIRWSSHSARRIRVKICGPS
jgi:hypothetical protein